QGLALARRWGDHELLWVAGADLILVAPARQWAERVELAREAAGWPRQGVSPVALGWGLHFAGLMLLSVGEREKAEQVFRELAAQTERSQEPAVLINAQVLRAILATI